VRRFLPSLFVLLVLATGCSDDDAGVATGEGTAATDDTGTTATTVELTGSPYKLVSVIDVTAQLQYPEMRAALQAVADEVNATGGIDGHPVEIEVCETHLDANRTTQCARDAAADPEVVAAVGNFTNFGDGANAVFTEAGIPVIGPIPIGLADYSCEVCFPSTGGSIAGLIGQATLVEDVLQGDTVNLVITDVPAAAQLPALLEAVLGGRKANVTLDRVTPIAHGTADLSAPIGTALGNRPSGVMLALAHDAGLNFVRGARAQDPSVPIVVPGITFGQEDFELLGEASEGLYVASLFGLTGPAIAEFEAQMDAADPDAPKNDLAKLEWVAARLFVDVARDLPEVTRESLLDALNGLSGYETGLTPPLDFTSPFEGLGGAVPRLFNTTVTYAQVRDSQVEPLLEGEFADLFTAPAA